MGYSGHDRRSGALAELPATFGPSYFVALAGVVAVVVVVIGLRAGTASVGDVAPGLLPLRIVICAVTAAMCLLLWRLSGAAASVLIAAALLLLGPVYGAVDKFSPLVSDRRASSAAAAVTFVAIVLLLSAAWSPEVDDRAQPRRVVACSLSATVVVAVALWVLMPTSVSAPVGRIGRSDSLPAWLSLALAGAWLTVATRCVLVRPTRTRSLLPWLGLMAVACGLQEATRGVGALTGHVAGDASATLLLVGVLCVLWGVGRDLQVAFASQRRELFVTQVSRDHAEAQVQAVRAEVEERAHEARNALMAIEGATRILERNHDRLPAATRAGLAEAIAGEVAQLQRIIAVGDDGICRTFEIDEALAPAIAAARACGLDVLSSVGQSILATGRQSITGEVVQNLLTNAGCHAPGSPVTIESLVVDGRVLIRVSDRGPGVTRADRDAVFERGFRCTGTVGPGSGLGLYISKRLMHEQGGEIWLEGRAGGGTTFVLALPAAQCETTGSVDGVRCDHTAAPPIDGGEDVFEQADVHHSAVRPHRGSL